MLLESEEQQKNSFPNNYCVPRDCMFQLKHFRNVCSCHILFLHFLNHNRADCQGLFKITLWMYKFEDVGFMATTYISIFGFVIVVANTIVFFTEFSQKERILWIHIIFYLSMFISGIVALAGGA